MPESVGYPENLKRNKGPQQPSQSSDAEKDILRFCMASIKLWANTTHVPRLKVKREKRPALEVNQILPQVETACGMQRGENSIYPAVPRGLEDKRLGEVVSQA